LRKLPGRKKQVGDRTCKPCAKEAQGWREREGEGTEKGGGGKRKKAFWEEGVKRGRGQSRGKKKARYIDYVRGGEKLVIGRAIAARMEGTG